MLQTIFYAYVLQSTLGQTIGNTCLVYPLACEDTYDKLCCVKSWELVCTCKIPDGVTIPLTTAYTNLYSSLFSSFSSEDVAGQASPITERNIAVSSIFTVPTTVQQPSVKVSVGVLVLASLSSCVVLFCLICVCCYFGCKSQYLYRNVHERLFTRRRMRQTASLYEMT